MHPLVAAISESATLLLALAMGVVATLYACVGHGGASGYLALMALASVPAAQMRPTALLFNIAVSAMGTVLFFRAGQFRGRLFWPLAALSIPAAFIAGGIKLPPGIFHALLAVALGLAAARLFFPVPSGPAKRAPLPLLIGVGAVLGTVSGLIGVGGGILLTPLLILLRWADARTAAGVSAPFIFVNSIAGLAGMGSSGLGHLLPGWPVCLGAVLVGGWLGAAWGSGLAPELRLRQALGLVLALAVTKLIFTLAGYA